MLVVLLLVAPFSTQAQKSSALQTAHPFGSTEELSYKAELTRSLLRKIDVATFKFSVSRMPSPEPRSNSNDNHAAYSLKLVGDVESDGFFPRLFGIDFHQRVESTVEPNSFAVQKTVRLDEQGKRVRASEATFDHKLGKVTWVERDPKDPSRPERTLIANFPEPIQDVLSVIYFIRLGALEPGKKFEVPVSDSGRVYRIPIQVVEKKRMKTLFGRVNVVRIDPELFGPEGMIDRPGRLSIWITDDDRRIPVSARIKTEYGTFDVTLKKITQQPNGQPVLARQ